MTGCSLWYPCLVYCEHFNCFVSCKFFCLLGFFVLFFSEYLMKSRPKSASLSCLNIELKWAVKLCWTRDQRSRNSHDRSVVHYETLILITCSTLEDLPVRKLWCENLNEVHFLSIVGHMSVAVWVGYFDSSKKVIICAEDSRMKIFLKSAFLHSTDGYCPTNVLKSSHCLKKCLHTSCLSTVSSCVHAFV